jgi:hypothetical protein
MKSAVKRLEKERGGLVEAFLEFLDITFDFLHATFPLRFFGIGF